MGTVDLDNWHPTYVYLAFWLQDKIKKEGLEGIHYAQQAREWARDNAPEETADAISKELRKL